MIVREAYRGDMTVAVCPKHYHGELPAPKDAPPLGAVLDARNAVPCEWCAEQRPAPLVYRVIDARSGRVLARANTLPGLYPESDREWAKTQELTDYGWQDVPSMRRAPDGRWL